MGERTGYAAGSFCWADLGTTDQDAAKEFYGGLFGWQAHDTHAVFRATAARGWSYCLCPAGAEIAPPETIE